MSRLAIGFILGLLIAGGGVVLFSKDRVTYPVKGPELP